MRLTTALSSALFMLIFAACGGGSDGGTDAAGVDAIEDGAVADVDPSLIEARVEVDTDQGNAPLTVHFTGSYDGIPEGEAVFEWDFDNGSTSEEQNPTMVFTEPKTYKVRFTVTRRGTIFSASDDVLIKVNETAELRLFDVKVTGAKRLSPGEETTVSFNVINSGGRVDGLFEVAAYLSTNEKLDGQDVRVKAVEVDGIASGVYGESVIPFTDMALQIPSDTAYGPYYLFLMVDAGEVVSETNEEDNVRTAADFLEIGASNKADLAVDALSINAEAGTSLSQGVDNLNYQLSIRNQGNAAATAFKFSAYLSLDPVLDDSDFLITGNDSTTIFSLEPDGTRSFVRAYPLPEADLLPDGDYYLIARVDSGESVDESDESNNERASETPVSLEFVPEQGKDLAVTQFQVTTDIVYIGGSVATSLKIENVGTDKVSDYTYTYFISANPSLNPNTDLVLGTRDGPAIEAGAEVVIEDLVAVTDTHVTGPGIFYVSVYVNKDNKYNELDSSNNSWTDTAGIDVTEDATIDLELYEVEFHPTTVVAGNTVAIGITVKNNGSNHSGGFSADVVLSPDAEITDAGIDAGLDYVLDPIVHGGAGPGQQIEVTSQVDVPVALPHDISQYYVGVLVDHVEAIAETSEANNVQISAYPLTVLETAGGCFEDSYEPNDVQPEAQLIEAGTYEDLGLCEGEDWFKIDVPAGSALTVELISEAPLALEPPPSDLDLELYSASGTSLGGGALIGDYEKALVLGTPSARTIFFSVSPRDAGNRAHYDMTVTLTDPDLGVDLFVDQVAVSPTTIYPGGQVQIISEIFNGGADPSGNFNVDYYLSVDGVLDAGDAPVTPGDVVSLEGSGSEVIIGNYVLPVVTGGYYHVLVQVDAGHVVAEVNEDNNVGVSSQLFLDDGLVCEQDQFWPNTTIESAAHMAATSGSYSELFVCPHLPDCYEYALPPEMEFSSTINYSYTSSSGAVEVRLYDGTGTSIVDASSDPTNTSVSLPYVYYPGTYYVCVSVPDDAEPYEYTMGVNVSAPLASNVCPADAEEYNNSFELATEIGCGPSTHILCNKDVDIYRLQAIGGEMLKVTLTHQQNQARVGLYLEPGDPPVDQTSGNGSISMFASSSQVVYVAVEAVNPDSALASFSYDLFVEGVSGVDLRGEIESLYPESVLQGEDTDLSLRFFNECQDDAEASTFGVFLSDDELLDTGDVQVGAGSVDAIQAGLSVAQSQTVTLPSDAQPGERHLLLVTDLNSWVDESNEGNNVASIPVTVTGVCQDDEAEQNDDLASGSPLSAGILPDLMICKNDQDWFKILLSTGDELSITLSCDPAGGDIDMRLYGADGSSAPLLSGTESEGGAVETLSWTADASGLVYLRVIGFNEAQNAYSLEVDIQ